MNAKKITATLLATIIIASTLTGCSKITEEVPAENDTQQVTDNKEEYTEPSEENTKETQEKELDDTADSNKTSDDKIVNDDGEEFIINTEKTGTVKEGAEPLDSNKFIIGGKTYTFPIKISDLLSSGWHLPKNSTFEDSFEANSTTNLVSFYLINDEGVEMTLRQVKNETSEAQKLENCLLTGFQFHYYDVTSEFEFSTPGGITLKSTAADVISVMGNPNNSSEFKGYSYNLEEQLTYTQHKNSGISYSFAFIGDSQEEYAEFIYSLSVEYSE